MDRNELSHDPCHLGVASGVAKMIFHARGTIGPHRAPILCWDQHYLQTDRNELPHDPRHLEVPSGVPKWLPCPWYVQRYPCTYLVPRLTLSPNGFKRASAWSTSPRSTTFVSKMISKPMVRLAQTVHYLALRLTLSPNRLKRASTRPLSPRSTIGCAQSDFTSYGTFGANRTPICVATLSPNRPKHAFTWPMSPLSTIMCV